MYKIEQFLNGISGAKSELSRQLEIAPSTLSYTLKNKSVTLGNQKRYTDAFNKCFETNYKYSELFSEVSEE